MDIQVNKDQLYRVVIKWLSNHFGDLTPKTTEEYPESVFYVNSDNQVMMEYYEKKDSVFIQHQYIWSKIKSIFPITYKETQSIMKVWLEDTYNLEEITPYNEDGGLYRKWNRITNWND